MTGYRFRFRWSIGGVSLPPGGLRRDPVQCGKRRQSCRHRSRLALNAHQIGPQIYYPETGCRSGNRSIGEDLQ